MRVAVSLAALVAAVPAAAQVFVDGSDRAIDQAVIEAFRSAAAGVLRDAASAEVSGAAVVGSAPAHLCGYLNARNGFGAYVGFQPFAYNVADRTMQVWTPQPTTAPTYALSRQVFALTGCLAVVDIPPADQP